MTIAPIIGKINEETISLAEKIAKVYNDSIKEVNDKTFLGFNFKIIPELKDKKASLNFIDNLLEIHVNKNAKIIIPSRRTDEYTLAKFFEFNNAINNLDNNCHILLENSFNKNSLKESMTLKGKASRFISSKIKSGIESAKKIISGEIEIQNPESLKDLSNNINRDLNKILDLELGEDKITKAISDFVKNGNVSNINDLYNMIFESSLKSKFANECKKNVYNIFKKHDGSLDKNKKELNAKVIDIVANSYDTDVKSIESRSDKDYLKIVKKAYTIISKSINVIINTLKGAVYTVGAYIAFSEGIGSLIMKVADWVSSGLKNLIQLILGPSSSEQQMAKALSQSEGFIDKAVGYINIGLQKGMTTGLDKLDGFKTFILDLGSEAATSVESLPYIGTVKYLVFAALVILALISIKNLFKDMIDIKDIQKTSGKDIAADFSIDSLTSNGGFDKIFVTEAIMCIVTVHIESSLKNANLSSEEKERLKKLNHAIYNSHKKKTKEGIRFFYKELSNLN